MYHAQTSGHAILFGTCVKHTQKWISQIKTHEHLSYHDCLERGPQHNQSLIPVYPSLWNCSVTDTFPLNLQYKQWETYPNLNALPNVQYIRANNLHDAFVTFNLSV